MAVFLPVPAQAAEPTRLDSLFDMIVGGGPLMIPIALCSVVALAYTVERWIRLSAPRLGTKRFATTVLAAARDGGPESALRACNERGSALARVLAAGLKRRGEPTLEVEKAVEDAGSREVRRLSANLRPLMVVVAIAPLLGLLGTVWGMIEAFSSIALRDGLGKPELLASGIAQALITTAAGLSVAIPTQAVYFYFKSRIDRFVRLAEDAYTQLAEALPRLDPETGATVVRTIEVG